MENIDQVLICYVLNLQVYPSVRIACKSVRGVLAGEGTVISGVTLCINSSEIIFPFYFSQTTARIS